MKTPDHIQQAIQAYYAERATDEDIAALEAWFREDIAHVRMFAEHGMVEWQMRCEQDKADAAAILTILREAEEHAHPTPIVLDPPETEAPTEPEPQPITFREVREVAGYLFDRGLHTRAAAIGAVAAVLLLAVTVFVVVLGRGDAPSAVAPPTATGPQANQAPIVATLTTQYDAAWADGSFAPGSQLRVGDRLTLSAGFAEITTKRGTIVILQGPATIELIENNNAIYLHTGKLVGICETNSSKGFLVRTPQLDVVDRGTQFGVEVKEQGEVLAEVFQGFVDAHSRVPGQDHLALRSLTGGESIALDSKGQEIAHESFGSDSFARLKAFSSGILALSDGIRCLPVPSVDIELVDWNAGQGTIITEDLRQYRLESDLSVNLSGPGTYLQFDESTGSGIVPRGTVIRSYVLATNPGPELVTVTARGSVTFHGEILGVITAEEQWNTFVSNISSDAGPTLVASTRQVLLESNKPDDTADEIILADDGRTLIFKFVTEGYADAVRVIVREPIAGDAPQPMGN